MQIVMEGMEESFRCFFPSLLICSLIIPAISAANDTLITSESIKDGETLVSSGGMFELGFFSPGKSGNRYLGIWYKNIPVQTVVWVANGGTPLTTNSGVLRVTETGILALFNSTNGTIIWSSNTTRSVENPSAQLLESGNLVVKDDDDVLIWQSFDHPSDTFLPGMIMGWNSMTGSETFLTSWKSDDDPSPGEFTAHLNPTGYPQILMKRLGRIQWRSGPWNGIRFSVVPGTRNNPTVRMHKNDFIYMENVLDQSAISRGRLSPDGVGQRWTWNDRTNSWTVYSTPLDSCDRYNSCSANGICNTAYSPPCRCLDRFVPEELNRCVRRTPLTCEDDTFVKYSGVKLPDSRYSTFNDQRLMLADCRAECSMNCNCTAYAQLDIREETSGCLFYYRDFVDIKAVDQNGRDLYIKIASADLDFRGKNNMTLILSSTLVAVPVLVCLIVVLIWAQKRKRRKGQFNGSHGEEAELPLFKLSTILKATRRFSVDNKLGEGGCGPVYKGVLEDGQEIAVKRLSKSSSQGVDELKNEVVLITKLQHRNLVRTLGCCADGEEYMLIYEYMPNSSLDLILFDYTKSTLLDWQTRFNIINGIAKGLLYLHQDSRLRIIHRDIKASNILLDADMNPKISDFGIARSFGGNETSAKTHRVVGTYGYMSPEYAIDGLFSVKSDVFSFGVLVIEIVSGKRNKGMFIRQNDLNLLEYAWTLNEEGKACELVDASLKGSFSLSQALRAIHVALLCVQKYPEERPSMSSVILMLGNEAELPHPKQPGFSTKEESVSREEAARSDNEVTITVIEAR